MNQITLPRTYRRSLLQHENERKQPWKTLDPFFSSTIPWPWDFRVHSCTSPHHRHKIALRSHRIALRSHRIALCSHRFAMFSLFLALALEHLASLADNVLAFCSCFTDNVIAFCSSFADNMFEYFSCLVSLMLQRCREQLDGLGLVTDLVGVFLEYFS